MEGKDEKTISVLHYDRNGNRPSKNVQAIKEACQKEGLELSLDATERAKSFSGQTSVEDMILDKPYDVVLINDSAEGAAHAIEATKAGLDLFGIPYSDTIILLSTGCFSTDDMPRVPIEKNGYINPQGALQIAAKLRQYVKTG